VAIKSGRTIAGMELSLTAAGAAVKTPYRFKGGGELMIFALTRDASHQEQQATEN